jgi:hypothetical protein
VNNEIASETRPVRAIVGGFLTGLGATVPAVILAIISGGSGHGNYAFALALFPFPMLLTQVTHDSVAALSIVLALVQFPIYGAILGYYRSIGRNEFVYSSCALGFLHAVAAVVCFAVLPNFS